MDIVEEFLELGRQVPVGVVCKYDVQCESSISSIDLFTKSAPSVMKGERFNFDEDAGSDQKPVST